MVEVNGKYYDSEEDAHKAVEAECSAYRRERARFTEDEKRARAAGDRFFALLREQQPNLFKRRLISLPILKIHKMAIEEAIKPMEHLLPSLITAVTFGWTAWPIRISEAASREFQYWLRELKDRHQH
jgi:hypothetical protein